MNTQRDFLNIPDGETVSIILKYNTGLPRNGQFGKFFIYTVIHDSKEKLLKVTERLEKQFRKNNVQEGARHHSGAIEEDIARVIDIVMLLEIINAIAFSDIRDYIDFGPDGLKVKNLAEIDTLKLHPLKTYRVDNTRKTFCIRLHDKGKALAMLLKITGGLKSRMDLTNEV